MDTSGVVWRQTAGRDRAMDVRVVEQILSAGMQNAEESDLGAQMLGIGRHLDQSLGASALLAARNMRFAISASTLIVWRSRTIASSGSLTASSLSAGAIPLTI